MGHKVHPTGFRLGVIRDWDARWYADRHYREYLQEDLKLRDTVRSLYPEAGVSRVEIDRQANNITVTVYTARPGILIGRGGQRVDELRNRLERMTGKRVQLNIREIPQPELDAYLVARNVADQMERRIAYRRALKQTLQRTMQAGARGMRISAAGRLDGAEIARRVTMHEGRVPLHTLRADIDYGFAEARTTMGRIGVKVWIYKGDILPLKAVEAEELGMAAPAGAAPEESPAQAAPGAEVEPAEAAPEAEAPVAAAPEAEVPVAAAPEGAAAETTPEATAEVAAGAAEEPAKAAEGPAKPPARKRTRKAPASQPEAEAESAGEAPARPKRRSRKAASAEAAEAPAEETPAGNQGESDATTQES